MVQVQGMSRRDNSLRQYRQAAILPELRQVSGVVMSERDPRVDPRPGDVLRRVIGFSNYERRVVCCGMSGGTPTVTFLSRTGKRHTTIWLTDWRKWAANAEIVKRGRE